MSRSCRKDYLPQSEAEWLATERFEVQTLRSLNNTIRTALVRPTFGEPNSLVVMVGGIPRDPERRRKLPLVNKLYGHLALKLADVKQASLLYNQPDTGKSTGNMQTDTLESRTETLVDISLQMAKSIGTNCLSLVGTSAGAYMSIRAISKLYENDINVQNIVLQSPAAYPVELERIPYGELFKQKINQPWDTSLSPAFYDLEKYSRGDGRVYLSFFERDDPPIPQEIQDYYHKTAEYIEATGASIITATIAGVEHNFRRIGSNPTGNVVDNDSIRATALAIADFLA